MMDCKTSASNGEVAIMRKYGFIFATVCVHAVVLVWFNGQTLCLQNPVVEKGCLR